MPILAYLNSYILIENMSFHTREQRAISQDEHDNQAIRQIIQRYNQVKQQLQSVLKQLQGANTSILCLEKQNKSLKQDKQQLLKQLERYKTAQKTMGWTTKVQFDCNGTFPPMSLAHQKQMMATTMQTKRRVINGFVADLTLQLDQNDDVLRRERKMLAQSRRQLQLKNDQVLILRKGIRQLECELNVAALQNKQLRQRNYQQIKNTFLLGSYQFDDQMAKMDEVYRAIQISSELD